MLSLRTMMPTAGGVPQLGLALLGGGARAAYQVGVLTRLAEGHPELSLPLISGVSAGSANAVGVAGASSLGECVAGLRQEWRRLDPALIFDLFPSGRSYSLFGCLREAIDPARNVHGAFLGFFDDRPIRTFVSKCANFSGIASNLDSGRLQAVALTASSYDTGNSVTFFQGQRSLKNWSRSQSLGVAADLTLDHVMASGAIPLLFPPIRIAGGLYGDGNVRQQFPLSPLIRLGADRIFVIDPGPSRQSVQTRGPAHGTMAETLGLLLDSMVVDRIESDIARLGEINERLASQPRVGASHPHRPIDLLYLRPSRDLGAVASSLGPPRSKTLRFVVRAAGGWNARVAGLLSYLWVEPCFTDRLFDLGYSDAHDRWAEIESFLDPADGSQASPSRAAG